MQDVLSNSCSLILAFTISLGVGELKEEARKGREAIEELQSTYERVTEEFHAENENIRIGNLLDGITTMGILMMLQ